MKPVGREHARCETIEQMVNKAKGEVCKEFEKICMTDRSFERVLKDMHTIFDQLTKEIKQL